MGDQVSSPLTTNLAYVPYAEFQRVLNSNVNKYEKCKIFAQLCRINILYMVARAGSGHLGSSFSSIDIIVWIYLNQYPFIDIEAETAKTLFYSSKGHDAPAFYSVFTALGILPFEKLHTFRQFDGLPGHPDISTDGFITNTGSLGMGISKAKGMISAAKLTDKNIHVFVLTGDGELQEGQIWESLISAANNKVANLTVIVDFNKMQSDKRVTDVSDLGDLKAKFKSFGWSCLECNGHDPESFSSALCELGKLNLCAPRVIIADTIKGKGVSFMENTFIDSDLELYKFHSGAPSNHQYDDALIELTDSANNLLATNSQEPIQLGYVRIPPINKDSSAISLVKVYEKCLVDVATENNKVVVLDADLMVDVGLLSFKERFPARFIECGIAEQDMVSQAGGLALLGMIPVVHSFASFLSARANEQIYNNASEKTKIIYIGSLAGLLPSAPGHSHQGVRDISTLGAIPGLVCVEPSVPEEVFKLLFWAINEANESVYIRLSSVPDSFEGLSLTNFVYRKGVGNFLKKSGNVVIVAYGPQMVKLAMGASKLIEQRGIEVSVCIMPWLNFIDEGWFFEKFSEYKYCYCIDNHYDIGGLADRISRLIHKLNINISLRGVAINELPKGGSSVDVLEYHGFDSDRISCDIIQWLKSHN